MTIYYVLSCDHCTAQRTVRYPAGEIGSPHDHCPDRIANGAPAGRWFDTGRRLPDGADVEDGADVAADLAFDSWREATAGQHSYRD